MNWYYVAAGQQKGPVPEAELDALAQSGQIQSDTLVWCEGLAGWLPYSQARPSAAPPLAATAPAAGEAVCAECNRAFSRDQVIRYDDVWVCAGCKPRFFQRLREGAAKPAAAGPLVYAGFWIRFAAKLLDGLIVGGVMALVLGLTMGLLLPAMARSSRGSGNQSTEMVLVLVMVGVFAIVILGGWFYMIWCLPKYGGTPGKRILGLRVVTAEGGPISWGRAFGRFFAEMLNGLIPLYIGYIIAGFDAEKRALHDHIAGTRVIKI